ncbi:MAG: hypothetical protein ISS65_00170 [Desulfobacterales bacterium]|uniref:Uncharacterized protein n=1 Tax=Candidatus Desulfatibia profunda TaxID=2841695 RepID=A0A8J6TH64_9BACT|nr:hypothetical protein [Candidatus Desulfatibia profunda]MBL7178612.1 hypothetical protein [Desulfobacterales bacterium]
MDERITMVLSLSNDIINLHHDSAGGNHHDPQLHRPDFIVGNSFFPGNAKEMLRSRVAAQSHGRSQLDHMGCFFIEHAFILD